MSIAASFSFKLLMVALTAGIYLLTATDLDPSTEGIIEVPAAFNPDKLSILQVMSGKGVQVYACARHPAGATGWAFKAPDAQLFDMQNKPIGKHYAGPTWEDLDGGKVVGAVRTSIPASLDNAIPWLLLDVKSHQGSGAVTQARAIVRMETTGGAAPDDGCDEPRTGQEVRVGYTAIYVFLK